MPPRPITIESASAGDLLADARALFEQYRRLCGGEDLEKEGIADEIAGLPWVYQAPYGDLLVAKIDGTAAGCIALRTRAHGEGEIKRMFVLPGLRGLGVESALLAEILGRARALGMERVVPSASWSLADVKTEVRRSMHGIHRFQAKYALVLRNLRHQVQDATLTMGDK